MKGKREIRLDTVYLLTSINYRVKASNSCHCCNYFTRKVIEEFKVSVNFYSILFTLKSVFLQERRITCWLTTVSFQVIFTCQLDGIYETMNYESTDIIPV